MRFNKWMRRAIRIGFGTGGLAEEIVLFDGRKARVCVGRADQAKLVRIDAELLPRA